MAVWCIACQITAISTLSLVHYFIPSASFNPNPIAFNVFMNIMRLHFKQMLCTRTEPN